MDSLPAHYVPELRPYPPWLMDEMVAAQPGLVRPILANQAAAAIAEPIRKAAGGAAPITVVGCGTSETAAMAVADLLADSLVRSHAGYTRVIARQALEAALDPWPGGVCLGISHEGGTRATILAMDAARRVGARTALVTARSQSAGAKYADDVFVTPLIDRSWCHTVGYASPMLAGAAIAEAIAPTGLDPTALEAFLKDLLTLRRSAAGVARTLGNLDRIVVVGAGPDRSPAKELALKIEEGARLPARMLELETLLHGHLAACDAKTGLLLIATGGPERALKRAALAVRACRRVGMTVAAILSQVCESDRDSGLMNGGFIVLPSAVERLGLIGRLAGAALCLQQLTLELAAVRGTNPDLIRRDQEPYRQAASIAESEASW